MDLAQISLSKPPKGWAVLKRVSQLDVLLDANIKAVTLLPHDFTNAEQACAALELLPVASPWRNSERQLIELGTYTLEHGRVHHHVNIHPATLSSNAALQAAFAEVDVVGAALAALFVQPGTHFMRAQLSDWHGFHNTGRLHLDNKPRTPVHAVHIFGGQPTIVELDGRCWHGPYGSHHIIKTSTTRHCANRTQPQRPHKQIGHDVVQIVENLLD